MSRVDPHFLKQINQRREAAFDKLVREHQESVVRYLTKMIGDREVATDLGQDVFLTAFRFADGFRGECSPKSWLFKIAGNLCKNKFRYRDRRKHNKQDSIEEMLETSGMEPGANPGDSPEQIILGRELEELVNKGIMSLAMDYREVLILRDIELMSYDEIADLTGLARGTVKSRLHRARFQLTDYLEKNGG